MPLELELANDRKQHVKLFPRTAAGSDTTLKGVPIWTVTEGAGTVVPDADGLAAYCISSDTVDGVQTVIKIEDDGLTDNVIITTIAASADSLNPATDGDPIAK